MKLAPLKSGTRDGTLIVVDRHMTMGRRVPWIAGTMQAALDTWADIEKPLLAVYDTLNLGEGEDAFPLDIDALAAPLSRTFQWCDGSAYLSHAELVR